MKKKIEESRKILVLIHEFNQRYLFGAPFKNRFNDLAESYYNICTRSRLVDPGVAAIYQQFYNSVILKYKYTIADIVSKKKNKILGKVFRFTKTMPNILSLP